MLRWVIFISFYLLLSFYGFQAIKTIFKSNWLQFVFIAVALLILGNFIYNFTGASEGRVLTPAKSYAFGFILAFLALNLVIVPILFAEDVVRVIAGVYDKFSAKESFYMPSRRRFISLMALGLASIPFGALLYGMHKGKYNFRVLDYTLFFEDLPDEFDGYRITQISDIHSGSFDNREKIEYAIDLVNKQASDTIMFTGDMVNNKASEMIPWKGLFGQLNAKDGIYSVLGNHDYGDYVSWPTNEDKAKNLEELITIQKEMGFDLLLNESRFIEKNGQRIAIVGVEN